MPASFVYSKVDLAELERCLSSDRLSTYMGAVGHDKESAVRLYVWNMTISAAFYSPLQALEITIRNGFHHELTQTYGPSWYNNPRVPLTAEALRLVQNARAKLAEQGKAPDPGRMVAELSFGFWERLLSKGPKGAYEMKLWRPALHKAFPHARKKRSEVHLPVQHLRVLRNRIAHHEPIFARHLAQDYRSLTDVLGWISPEIRRWVEHHSNIHAVLAQRP